MVSESPRPYNLLIADDNSAFRELIREFLEPREVLRLFEVESGEEAIEFSQEHRVDIVLLDMYMHELTGLETLIELKEQDLLRPCILMSSELTDAIKEDALRAQAFSVLTKPVRRAELCSTIVDALIAAYHDESVLDVF